MNQKILILESSWAESENYMEDSRSTAKIYASAETLLSIGYIPVQVIQRPLLKRRFNDDIYQFTQLYANQRGVNLIILSAHGYHEIKEKGGVNYNRRIMSALDGDIDIGKKVGKISEYLSNSIVILDSCAVGVNIDAFYHASGALGVIGFTESVSWIDSSAFILSLILKYQEKGVFELERRSVVRPRNVLNDMKENSYSSLMNNLGVQYYFG